MSDEKFLQSKHFCVLPWMHARVNQDGSVYPCCRMENFYSYGSLKDKSFNEIWNDPAIRNMRNTLKKDLAFSSCSDCYNIEAQNGISLRQKANSDFSEHIAKVAETHDDGRIAATGLEFIDLRFSNICNFKCRTCNYENSTSWYQDARNFVTESVPTEPIRTHESAGQLWAFIRQQLPTLKRIYLAGGEPLLHEEHYQLLELLIAENRTDIAIEYNTNLSTIEYKHWKATELWKQFPHITVGASLDGVNRQAELIRKGMDWGKTYNNFLTIQNESPQVKFILAPTISVLNCFHITVAIEEFVQNGMLGNPDFLRLNILLQPHYLNVQILNPKERHNLEQHYSAFLNRVKEILTPKLYFKIDSELNRILTHMSSASPKDGDRLRFRKFTIKLDSLRKEKTALLFPELFDLIYEG